MSYNIYDNVGVSGVFSKAGLAEGTNANTIKIAAPNGAGVDYAIDGLFYHKADTDNIAMTAGTAQAVLTTCLYLIQIDSDGNVTTKQGNVAANDSGVALVWPKPDAAKVALGGLKVRCNNSATFTAGSTDLSATDVVDTFYDFAGGGPPRGLVA